MARVLSKPPEAFTFKYLLCTPNAGVGVEGRKSVNKFITTSKTPKQIKATWERIAKDSNGSVSLSDLFRPEIGVNTIATVNQTLTIEDVSSVITGDDIKVKIPAAWLFTDAAPGAHIHCKISWELFQFPPNSLTSHYVDCDLFTRMEVSKSAVKKDGLFDQERIFDTVENGGPNIGKWSVRATIQPSKNAYKAVVNLSAVPWETREFPAKPGNVDAPSYPNIHVKVFESVSFNGKNTEEMGLPFYTLLSYHEEGELGLDTMDDHRQFTENINEAVTAFFSSAKKPVCIGLSDWLDMFPQNNGEPEHDDILSQYSFPIPPPSDGDSAGDDRGLLTDTEDEDDDTEVDASGVSSLNDISELRRLARTTGMERSRMGSSPSDDSPKRKKLTKKRKKASTPISESEDDSPAVGKPKKKRAKKPAVRSSRSDSGDESPSTKKKSKKDSGSSSKHDGFKIPRRVSTIVPKSLWPAGSSADSIDKLSVDQVLAMKSLESKIRKEQKSNLPGISLVQEDDEVTPIRFDKATDNGRNKLHDARWLPLPIEDIYDWWSKIPPKRTDIIVNLDFSRFGTACNVAQFTIRVRHDRRYKGLQVKHFLPQNATAENRANRTFMTQEGAGFSCENTLDFVDTETVRDVNTAVLNMQSIDAVLWPMDYTANVILRVAGHFGHWARYDLDVKDQVLIYKTLVKEVLRKNAEKWNKPPMMFDAMVKLAEETMESARCPSMRPFVYQKLKQAAKNPAAPKHVAPKPSGPPKPAAPPVDRDWDLRAEFKGSRCCLSYNKGVRCNRKISGDFCHDGKSAFKYVHVCCKKVANGICAKTHPAIKHI